MKRSMRAAFRGGLPLVAGVVIGLTGLQPTAARAETFNSSNVDSRVVVAFQVNAAAAQAWLPEGWTLAPFSKGPFAGANLLVVLVDRYLELDAKKKPTTPASFRGVALASLATKANETRLYVTRIYATPPDYDPYGNAKTAEISRSAKLESARNVAPALFEGWSVAPKGGGEMTLKLSYQAGTPSWSEAEALPYSNVKPGFHRIYRYRQLADLAMSVPAGKALDGKADFASTIPELAPMFDGSEKMIGVVEIPVYLREVYLP